jgi:glycerol-3-phosphate dehydrogenase (NAD(P)+)
MKISVIGAGAFGTSLGNIFAKAFKDQEILILTSCFEKKNEINSCLSNKKYFSEFVLEKNLRATNDLNEIFEKSQSKNGLIFVALPSYCLEEFLIKNQNLILENLTSNYFVFCTKGISKTGFFFDEIVSKIFGPDFENFAFLLGPSFAKEILIGARTFVNLVSKNKEKSVQIIEFFESSRKNGLHPIKFVFEDDLKGAQICAMMKNICAIFLGILRGAKMHDDLCAAFFTFFLKEILFLISLFSNQKSGLIQSHIIFSFAGIGDLFLTSTSEKSRNFSFGFLLGQMNHEKKDKEGLILFLNEFCDKPEGFFALQNLFNSDFFSKNQISCEVDGNLFFSKKLFDFFDEKCDAFFDFNILFDF